MPRNGSKTAGTTTIAEPLRTDRRGPSRNAANVYCAAAPSTTILDICVQQRGSNTIMMSDFTPMAFGSFGRIRAFSGRKDLFAATSAARGGFLDRLIPLLRSEL